MDDFFVHKGNLNRQGREFKDLRAFRLPPNRRALALALARARGPRGGLPGVLGGGVLGGGVFEGGGVLRLRTSRSAKVQNPENLSSRRER